MLSRFALALSLLGTVGVSVISVSGQEVPKFTLWTPAELAQTGKPWVEYGNHRVLPAFRRVQSGGGELHKTEADVFVVQAGAATLTIGGELVDAKTTNNANEVTGTAVRGGTSSKLTAGMIVHIPANVPHQMLLEPGQQITYFVLKILQAP